MIPTVSDGLRVSASRRLKDRSVRERAGAEAGGGQGNDCRVCFRRLPVRPGSIYRERPVTGSSAVPLQSMPENEWPFLGGFIRAPGVCRYSPRHRPAVVSVFKRSQARILQSLRVQPVLESRRQANAVFCGRSPGRADRTEHRSAHLL